MNKIIDLLALHVARRRTQKGFTQEELGTMIGKTKQTIWAIENGKTGSTFETIAKLAEALDCQETDLVLTSKEGKHHTLEDCLETVNRAATGKPFEVTLRHQGEETTINVTHGLSDILKDLPDTVSISEAKKLISVFASLDESQRLSFLEQMRFVNLSSKSFLLSKNEKKSK